MKITNCKRNIMGTVSFDGQASGMRKPQDFIVYPLHDSGETIQIQSDRHFGQLDLATGAGLLSVGRKNAVAMDLAMSRMRGTAARIQLAPEDLQTLRGWIKSTGGLEVGESWVKTDNTGAMAL